MKVPKDCALKHDRSQGCFDVICDACQEQWDRDMQEAAAYRDIVGNGYFERAHLLGGKLGSNVWHNAVELAERFKAIEALFAVKYTPIP